MNVFLLCVVALLFLGWVYVLKLRISDLEKENGKMKAALKRYVRETPADLHVIEEDARPVPRGGEEHLHRVSTVSTQGGHRP